MQGRGVWRGAAKEWCEKGQSECMGQHIEEGEREKERKGPRGLGISPPHSLLLLIWWFNGYLLLPHLWGEMGS